MRAESLILDVYHGGTSAKNHLCQSSNPTDTRLKKNRGNLFIRFVDHLWNPDVNFDLLQIQLAEL